MTNTNIQNFLNQAVATQGSLYMRLHQFHWYVKGPNFFVLHEKFEELYDRTTGNMDILAERLLSIGGEPYATLEKFKIKSILKENESDKNLSAEEMAQAVIVDFKAIREMLSEGIKLAEEAGDDVTTDILIGMKADIDKELWFFQAFQKKCSILNKIIDKS